MKQKKNRNGTKRNVQYCPYCGSRTELRSASGIYHMNQKGTMLFVCKNYPRCDTYVRALSGTNEPVGTLANGRLRALRTEAHRNFDTLHKTGLMSREEAYRWLSCVTGLPMNKAHIGDMGEFYCQMVITESKKLLDAQGNRARKCLPDRNRGGYRYAANTGAAACG